MRLTETAAVVGILFLAACDTRPGGNTSITPSSETAGTPPAQTPPPSFAERTAYPEVRRQLLAQGWSAYRLSATAGCAPGDGRCSGFAETVFCAATGQGTCWYTWKRGAEYLLIAAIGENDGQTFAELRQCSSLRQSSEHPWDWCSPMPGASSGSPSGEVPGLRAALDARYPGWSPEDRAEYCYETWQGWRHTGDFDDNGTADYLVKIRHASNGYALALVAAPTGFEVSVLYRTTAQAIKGQGIQVSRKGESYRDWNIDQDMVLPRDAPVVGTCESGSNIYVYQNGHFDVVGGSD
jgi:hypothetical protein